MTDFSYKDYSQLTDESLLKQIGVYVKSHRLRQNKTQHQVSEAAGMSRSTLSLLERGESVTLLTLVQVLRVLDLLHIMDSFQSKQVVSPLALAKRDRKQRQRARSKDSNQSQSNW